MRKLLLFLAMILCAPANAEARHWRYYGYYNRDSDQNAADDRSRNRGGRETLPYSARGGGFGPTVEQLIRGCSQEALELQQWPFDSVARVVGPSEEQRGGLEQLRGIAADAGRSLASACPKDAPRPLTERLDLLERVLGSFVAALDTVRPPIETFYGSLDDEQKARLVAMYMSNDSSQDPNRSRGSARNARPPGDGADRRQDLVCTQWAVALRAWPVRQIEAGVTLSDAQRAGLYELTAAIYRAAGTLAASCPTEASFTPVGQIDAKRKRVEALRQAVGAIRPALDRFAATLSEAQQMRVADAVNTGQIRPARQRGGDDD